MSWPFNMSLLSHIAIIDNRFLGQLPPQCRPCADLEIGGHFPPVITMPFTNAF